MTRLDKVLEGEGSWWSWALDQFLHALVGAAVAFPLDFWTGLNNWIIILLALLIGVGREYLQYLDNLKPHLLDRSVDAAFFGVGALIVCLVF